MGKDIEGGREKEREAQLVIYYNFFFFYQELLKEKSNPRLKGNRKGIIVKDKEFYKPILNTLPHKITRTLEVTLYKRGMKK